MLKKKIQNTARFKDFSKINGFDSGKNYSITSKHQYKAIYNVPSFNPIPAKNGKLKKS
jgi:hypothetical protein